METGDNEHFLKVNPMPKRRSSGQSLQAQFNAESSDSERLGTFKSRSSNNDTFTDVELTQEELEQEGQKILEDLKLLLHVCNSSEKVVEKESSEMFLNPAAFQPDILYRISLKNVVDPFSPVHKLDGLDNPLTLGSESIAQFKENLDTLLLAGENSDEMKNLGIQMKLIREYNS